MSEPSVNLLLSLPSALSCEVLSVWLHVPCLVRVDSAYCVYQKRPLLQELYEQPHFICLLEYRYRKNLLWFLTRRMRVNYFDVCEEVPPALAFAYLEEFNRSIKSVRLSKGESFKAIHAVIANCPQVSELKVCEVNDPVFDLIGQLERLENLDITFQNEFTSDQSVVFELPNLHKLRLVWSSLVDTCPNLTHFSLLCGHNLKVPLSTTMISGLTKLVALNLHSLPINDAALVVIVNHCPLIEHLDLRCSYNITDDGLQYAARRLRLQTIGIYSGSITDRGLFHLHNCSLTLRALYIAFCFGYHLTGISKISLRAAVNKFLSRTNIRVYDWQTDIVGKNFSSMVCWNATTIVVSVIVTDILLCNIARHCNQLQYLDIVCSNQDSLKYTSAGLYALFRTCFRLRTVRVNKHMDQREFGVIMDLYKDRFACSDDNAGSLYDVMKL